MSIVGAVVVYVVVSDGAQDPHQLPPHTGLDQCWTGAVMASTPIGY